MIDVNCPYCNKGVEINHDDGYGYEEDVAHQQECSCGKTFVYYTSISFSHEAYPAECLNGAEHDWKPTHTIPRQYAKMECSMCGEERQPTQEEKVKHEII